MANPRPASAARSRRHVPAVQALAVAPQQPSASASTRPETLTRFAHALIQLCGEDGARFAAELSHRLGDVEKSLRNLSAQSDPSQTYPRDPAQAEEAECELLKAVVAVQCFDRISQRLNHILSCLSLSEAPMMGSESEPERDRKIRILVRAALAMEHDRDVFDAIEAGASADEAVRLTAKGRRA